MGGLQPPPLPGPPAPPPRQGRARGSLVPFCSKPQIRPPALTKSRAVARAVRFSVLSKMESGAGRWAAARSAKTGPGGVASACFWSPPTPNPCNLLLIKKMIIIKKIRKELSSSPETQPLACSP